MSDFERLRHLLLADERDKLATAEQRIIELERVNRELAAQLPGLVRAAPAEPMSRALASPVAAALGNAVQRNRASIVDALFPVIGPIIRKAIAEALRGMMRDLNQVLEHGFSRRGMRWRIEAWRSGVPFAQIVLKHSLRYQIDHVFLIERDSGLLLHRESSPGLPDLDADAIAGMLTAIAQFVRDSVGGEGAESLEAVRIGEHLLWVLDGPRASLACFIRGVPPASLRVVLSDRLEQIHAQFPDAGEDTLDDESIARLGLSANLEPAALVAASSALGDADAGPRKRPSLWPLLLIGLAIVLALGWYFLHIARWNERVEALQAGLRAHPGFLLTAMDSRPWRQLRVHGLLDADAEPLQPLLDRADLGEVQPSVEVAGYLSSDDAIVLKRARRLLDAPASVSLGVADGVLIVSGEAAGEWIDRRRTQAAWIAGVREVDWEVRATADSPRIMPAARPASVPADAQAAARDALHALVAEIEQVSLYFSHDTVPLAASDDLLRQLATSLREAQSLATVAGVRLHLAIHGCSDATGAEELNARLREERAGWLRENLRKAGVASELLDAATLVTAADATAAIRAAMLRVQVVEVTR